MARYRGPKAKKARALGEPVYGYSKAFEKKKYPPGQHGNSRRRKVKSEYGLQLQEKQKAKYTYGVLERQFANTYDKAARKKGITGVILLQMLEMRLDNVVYRLGLAPTRRAARQYVVHKHITVNGEGCNIPSRILKEGDMVGVREKSQSMEPISDALSKNTNKFAWLEMNSSKKEGKVLALPEREQIPENINEQLIVELYSK